MRTTIRSIGEPQAKPIIAAIKSFEFDHTHPQELLSGSALKPFVTISRESGAGGVTLAANLAEYLNEVDPADTPWSVWDRELAQRVAQESNISQTLVETLEDKSQNWLSELLGGFNPSDSPESASEFRVFWKTSATIRAIAQVGRAIIVGRGGAFVTSRMPQGIHIRLVAPIDYRIKNYAYIFGMSLVDAEKKVKELDHNRQAFYKRYWPNRPLTPQAFTATFNTAVIGEKELARSVAALMGK
jgi:cytidylate kinase